MTATAWSPQEDPDPRAILREARVDASNGRDEQALAKHVWYHQHALKFRPSLSAVRRSFAIGHWQRLGLVYPPALQKLKEVRDEAKSRILAEDERVAYAYFCDLVAINRYLEGESGTVGAFKEIDCQDTRFARRLFNAAQSALVRAREYGLCDKYIEPELSVNRVKESYRARQARNQASPFEEKVREFNERRFTNDASTLVALLVISYREEEAERAVLEFSMVDGDDEFHDRLSTELNRSLQGILPEPWP